MDHHPHPHAQMHCVAVLLSGASIKPVMELCAMSGKYCIFLQVSGIIKTWMRAFLEGAAFFWSEKRSNWF